VHLLCISVQSTYVSFPLRLATIHRTSFLAQLADIKKLSTHLISPFIIAGGLIFIYDYFAAKTEGRDVFSAHATPHLDPCAGWNL